MPLSTILLIFLKAIKNIYIYILAQQHPKTHKQKKKKKSKPILTRSRRTPNGKTHISKGKRRRFLSHSKKKKKKSNLSQNAEALRLRSWTAASRIAEAKAD